MNKQYIVKVDGISERDSFINYINNNYRLSNLDTKKEMINSNFPFIVDFNKNNFWVCNSITCCACASQANRIITRDEFNKMIQNKK